MGYPLVSCWGIGLVVRYFSGEVKEQSFGWLRSEEFQRARFFGACAVAGGQRDAVTFECAFGDLQPRAAARLEFVRHRLARLKSDAIDFRVLMNRRRAVA